MSLIFNARIHEPSHPPHPTPTPPFLRTFSKYNSVGGVQSVTSRLEIFLKFLRVSVSVSKKSRYRSQKYLVSKKSSSYTDIIFQRDTSNTFKRFSLKKSFNTSLKFLVSRLVLIHCQRHKGQGIENFDSFNTFSSKQKLQQALKS